MSVIVSGTDPPQQDVRSPRRPPTPAALAVVAICVLGYAALPSPPTNRGADQEGFAEAAHVASRRWLPTDSSSVDPSDPRRLGNRYVTLTGNGVATVDASGATTLHQFTEHASPQRITSDGDTAVVHGRVGDRAMLWTSSDGVRWQQVEVPWTDTVLAVAIRPGVLTVLGLENGREVVGTLDDDGWTVTRTEAPDTGLRSTGTGMVGRGRQADGTIGYLYSTDGIDWEPIGRSLSSHAGDVITLHEVDGESVARVPGTDTTLHPPALPIIAYWNLDDRHWIQTYEVVWWSTDGFRWNPLPVDRAHGVMGGAPVLLPFADRALISVRGARGSPRTVYTWILGA